MNFLPSEQALKEVAAKVLILFFLCATLWGLLKEQALPGSEIFALLFLVLCCHLGGVLVSLLKMPPLLGMLITGFLFRNLPFIPYHEDISDKWASALRSGALVIILLRAGLGLDPTLLKKMSMVCLRLAFIPCMVEASTAAVMSHFLLNLPFSMAFALGFVLSAVSPAVVVPSMLILQEKGYGQEKGISTVIIAASSIDDVFSITGFGLAIEIAFSKGDSPYNMLKGPAAIVVGLCYGCVVGYLLRKFPHPEHERKLLYRVLLLTLSGLGVTYVSQYFEMSACGALGCLGVSFFAAIRWRTEEDKNMQMDDILNLMWQLFQTFLFGLIGAEVSIKDLQKDIGYGMLVLTIGLVFRLLVSYFVLFGSDLNMKEKVFVAFAWLPKATVQAAIGSVALDLARSGDKGPVSIAHGKQILSVAVLSIIVTAPLGAVAIAILGPLLLEKSEAKESMERNACDDVLSNVRSGSYSDPRNDFLQHDENMETTF